MLRCPKIAASSSLLPIVLLGLLAAGRPARACTTAVVSGAATSDGRPILWKNRDADDKQNQVVYCSDGRYPYIGIVNKGDAVGLAIWAGINSQGFAIMNSASYNLEGSEKSVAEGNVMKLALQSCATVADFQALLEKSNAGGRDVAANFGVIDAQGGAAYFETDKKEYKRFNATDPGLAPRGYIVRTNYSDSGKPDGGVGFVRFQRATDLMDDAVQAKALTAQTLLRKISRDVANARIGSFPLEPRKKGSPAYAYTADSISRYDTASAAVFQGVKPGEDPSLSVLWAIIAEPVSGVAVPLWVSAGGVPKEVSVGPEPAPITAACDEIRDLLYPETKGDLMKYMAVEPLTDPKRGVLEGLLALEDANFKRTGDALDRWRRQAPSAQEISAFQDDVALQTLQGIRAVLDARRRDAGQPAPPPKKKAPKADSRGVSVSGLPK